MQTIICFGALLYTALGVEFFPQASSTLNEYDAKVNYVPGGNKVFVGMNSWHNNGYEDRRFKIYTAVDESNDGVECTPLSWTAWKNELNADGGYSCPTNQAIAGIYSEHSNSSEDRRFKFKCCDITTGGRYTIHSRHWSDMLNDFDGKVDYKCNPNEVMVGMWSTHNNGYQDRRFKVRCGLIQETENPLPFLSDRTLESQMNKMDGTFSLYYTGGKVMTGLWSEHDNSYEDRIFKVYTAQKPDGMTCSWQSWTEYQNEYDHVVDFTCPQNMVMFGFGATHNNGYEDRKFKFRCCEVGGGYEVVSKRYLGYANDWDAKVDTYCAWNEAMIGLYSYHDNGKEDRRFKIQCGTIVKDYDDCSEVSVIDIEIDESNIGFGAAKVKQVTQYSADYDACGTNFAAEDAQITISNSKSVEVSESFTLGKSLDESFSFSQQIETTMKIGTKVSASVDAGVAKASAETSMEFSLRTQFTADQGFAMGSSETSQTASAEVNLSVFSAVSTFKMEPFQWRQVSASYTEREVTVPVKLHAKCVRSDGAEKTLWIESELMGTMQTQISVTFEDLTPMCPQSYYHECECVESLASNYLPASGCQVHPNFDGHEGCYVYKGNNCGNGQGLNANTPLSNVPVCTDLTACPGSQSYLDYPLDRTMFEWSYIPCDGEQYYPGDPEYDGPQYEDLVHKLEGKHCLSNQHGTLGSDPFTSRNAAITECDKINAELPNTCLGVYDGQCDGKNSFYLCAEPVANLGSSDGSCVYEMQDKSPSEPVGSRRLEAAEEKNADELIPADMVVRRAEEAEDDRSCDQLFEAFGRDIDLDDCVDQ